MADDPDFGGKQFPGVGFPTPVSIPEDTVCRTLKIPADGSWEAVVMGALMALTEPWNWQQLEGGITREEAAERALELVDQAYEDVDLPCPVPATVPTPYWDDSTDLDDEAPADDQHWYGHVSGGDFIEDIAVWLVSGFLATTVNPQAALLYSTYERKFRLAFLAEGLPGFARVVIDEVLAGRVDLSGDAGDIIEHDFLADPELETHTVMVVYEPE